MWVGDVVLERFVIERPIASGGMGSVFMAKDRRAGHAVAVKVLDLASDGAVERFRREARVLSDLAHPGIVRYIAHGETEARESFLVMELLEGQDLARRLSRGGLSLQQSLDLIRRTAEALAFAHSKGVIHRDVKPSNLFLVDGDPARVKVLDFGIARLHDHSQMVTNTGAMLGTVGYMAPEQATGSRDVDARADVFALGCVLFEALAGRPVFAGEHAVAVLAKVLCEEAPRVSDLRPELDERIDALVARLLAKDPGARPKDAHDVLRAIDEVTSATHPCAPAAAVPIRRVTGSERRVVSVIFGEPRGAATAQTITPEQAEQEWTCIEELATRYAAQVTRLAGGGVVVRLSGRDVATDQAARAASCALALRALQPELRIVLATGLGDTTGQFPVGPVIDRAVFLLRVPTVADGQDAAVVIDDVTAGLLGARFDVSRRGAFHVLFGGRGEFEEPRLLLGKPTPCVGRDKELALLEATLQECVSDRIARAVLVTAPPGFGKSRLASEFLARIRSRDGARVVVARAEAVAAGTSLSLVQKLIRQATGVRDGEPVQAQRERLRSHLTALVNGETSDRLEEFVGEIVGLSTDKAPSALLRAARNDASVMGEQKRRAFGDWIDAESSAGPLVLVLEDLHWGDAPSVSYVDEALKRLAKHPLMVLALARPEIHDAFPRLWAAAQPEELRLRGLTSAAGERLVRAVLGDRIDAAMVERVVERADGNAFYLEELIRRVAEGSSELPETILAMAQSRLDRLEPTGRRALRAGSVFGERFWAGGVAALLEESTESADWLETLADREVLVRSPESRFQGQREYLFRHALLRDAAYASLTDDDRKRAHVAAAEWLERIGEHDAASVADHFQNGGAHAQAVPWLLRAAQSSEAAGDNDACLRLAERGIACGASGESRGLFRAMQAPALGFTGDWGHALEYSREAMSLVPRGTMPWFTASSAMFFAGMSLGNPAPATAFVEGVASLPAQGLEAGGPYGLATIMLVFSLIYGGAADQALEFIKRLDQLASAIPEPEAAFAGACSEVRALADFYIFERPAAAWRHAKDASKAFEGIGHTLGDGMALPTGAKCALECGNVEDAIAMALAGQALCDGAGISWLSEWNRYVLDRMNANFGDPREAVARESALQAIADPCVRNLRQGAIADAHFALGNMVDAERGAKKVVEECAALFFPMAAGIAVLARTAQARGRHREALEYAETGCALDQQGRVYLLDGSKLHLSRFEALLALGDRNAAREALRTARDRVLRIATSFDDPAERDTYLTRIEPNARTLTLAREWLGETSE